MVATLKILNEVLKNKLPQELIFYISKFCNKKIKYKKPYYYKTYQKKMKMKYHYFYH
tara:strand:- start:5753 stop:5923 length:171 start_codon:yes stop_codon:yes gene_type:complete